MSRSPGDSATDRYLRYQDALDRLDDGEELDVSALEWGDRLQEDREHRYRDRTSWEAEHPGIYNFFD